MQVGVHPVSLIVLLGLRAFVRLVPVALGVPPERLQGEANASGWGLRGYRILKGIEVHGADDHALTHAASIDRSHLHKVTIGTSPHYHPVVPCFCDYQRGVLDMFTAAGIFQDLTSVIETFAAFGLVAVVWALQGARRAPRPAPAKRRP